MNGKESAEALIEWLIGRGYAEGIGISNPTGIARCGTGGFVAAGSSFRHKLVLNENRVTVGPRTVCVYRVINKEAKDFSTFKTVDIEGIKYEVSKRLMT